MNHVAGHVNAPTSKIHEDEPEPEDEPEDVPGHDGP